MEAAQGRLSLFMSKCRIVGNVVHDQVSEDRKSGLTKVHPNVFLLFV